MFKKNDIDFLLAFESNGAARYIVDEVMEIWPNKTVFQISNISHKEKIQNEWIPWIRIYLPLNMKNAIITCDVAGNKLLLSIEKPDGGHAQYDAYFQPPDGGL